MNKARWHRVRELFDAALQQEPEARAQFLADACGDDRELLAEVASLVAADARDLTLLDRFALNAMGLDGPDLAQGTVVGAYRVLRVIGEGGMGMVYMAERADGAYEQRVALKVVKRGMDSAEILARFRAERQILARLEHPNISRLLDGGVTEDGPPYFVMEYVDGLPIDAYCDAHGLSIDARLRLFEVVCQAVRFAHGNLVVHRDLKPENVLVTAGGDVKLLDFGIGKVLTGDGNDDVTRVGERALTPAYASPEQLAGVDVSTATDVYSLGVVLHELLVGAKPAPAGSPDQPPQRPSSVFSALDAAERREIARRRGTHPDRLRRSVAGDLDVICQQALQAKPDRRFASVEAFAADIRRHLDGLPVQARPDSLGYRTAKFASRHRGALSAAAVVLLTMGGLIGFYTGRLRAERAQARAEADKATEVANLLINTFRMASPQAETPILTVRDLLDWTVQVIDTALIDFPELHSDFLMSTGMVYREYGDFEAAEPQLRRLVEINRELFDEPTALAIQGVSQLATTLQDQGEYDEAETFFEEALQLARGLPEYDPFAVAYTLNNLAKVRVDMGRYAVAEAPLREAAAIYGEYAREYGWYGVAVRNHARAVRLQGRMAEADSLYQLALVDQREHQSPVSVATAELLYELAEHRLTLGRIEEARAYSDESLSMRRSEFPDGHQTIGQSLVQQARLLRHEGRMDAARDTLDAGKAQLLEFLGDTHAWYVDAMREEAALLEAGGRVARAMEVRRRAWESARVALGPDHPTTQVAAVEAALSMLANGLVQEARTVVDPALEALGLQLGNEHWVVAYAGAVQGIALTARGDADGPERIRQGLRALRGALGGEAPTARNVELVARRLGLAGVE